MQVFTTIFTTVTNADKIDSRQRFAVGD